MADGFEAGLDASTALQGLEALGGDLATSLARSMAVAGGQVLRDEAKNLVPVGTGRLRDAIYLAYKDNKSTSKEVAYAVSWNAKVAPHGHLVEFGHWQPFVIIQLQNGDFVTTKVRRKQPKYTPAHPFLRPALDMAGTLAQAAMLRRARERLPELLAGSGATDEP